MYSKFSRFNSVVCRCEKSKNESGIRWGPLKGNYFKVDIKDMTYSFC
jgi:tRNA(Glu) U13 pseudouridine synthase TruD